MPPVREDRNRIHVGETHPITLCTGNMLGNSLGRYEEAETVLATTIIVSGARGGPHALQMSSLAGTLGKQGSAARQGGSCDTPLQRCQRGGIGKHRQDVFSRPLPSLPGDHAGASALYSEVLAIQSRILGPRPPRRR